MLKRSRGFDVPDFLAAGPRDVLVPAAAVEAARAVLHDAEIATGAETQPPRPILVLGGLLAAVAVVAIIVLLASHL